MHTFVEDTCFGKRRLRRELLELKGKPVVGFVDSNLATNDAQAHSTSGTLIKLFGNTIMWSSKRQPSVALSTMLAEFYASCDITRDIMWLRQHLDTLGLKSLEPTLVFEDNAGCIEIAKNPSNYKGTRQLETKFFFVRDEINKSIYL